MCYRYLIFIDIKPNVMVFRYSSLENRLDSLYCHLPIDVPENLKNKPELLFMPYQ
jgi:hypothetical protein